MRGVEGGIGKEGNLITHRSPKAILILFVINWNVGGELINQ